MVALERGRPRGHRTHGGWSLVYLEIRRHQAALGRAMSRAPDLDAMTAMELGKLLAELRRDAAESRATGQRFLFGG